mmetsp:Transcript_6085/g.15103  ORF Transcript_6085/g.15103 Transcript_6085/m.15103 type:complete len:106 (-) Transcript_6085:639-956(-)
MSFVATPIRNKNGPVASTYILPIRNKRTSSNKYIYIAQDGSSVGLATQQFLYVKVQACERFLVVATVAFCHTQRTLSKESEPEPKYRLHCFFKCVRSVVPAAVLL